MSTVALIDTKMKTTVQTVQTNRVQYTIDQLMRNRNPYNFIAKQIE